MALHKDLELEPGSTDPGGVTIPNVSNDPEYQAMLRASIDLVLDHQVDVTVRHVAELPNPEVPKYTAIDLRYGWRARPDLELSLTVRNALDPEHPEFNPSATRSEIPRDLYCR